ncbi:MAG: heme lyase CcmF/NrfE family subunit [Burkholderiales bacterium]|nr:heme lyase CcmF/NrfE family subunit [Burkholderiales bacterium]
MIPEIGHFALILALILALVQGILPLIGAATNQANFMAVARPAAQGQFVFVAIAFACLAYAFLANDFSVKYVATNSNSLLPAQYRFSAVWGGHEGSILLWTLTLSVWTLLVTLFSRHLPQAMAARVLGVMGLISIGFLLFTLMVSNPFERLLPAALEGRDLNPLLQDPGMVIHPPILYIGYVGFSVAFAFALAALMGGRLDAAWARWSRPWTTAAWVFLTLGIALGSGWAYYELGWGGWWFWDPVENASFLPWLVGTALIHSLAVTEKRGTFKSWTVLLAIAAFSLSLLGTFLVRSGVLTSVHAFATDPKRGVFILIFLTIVIGASLLLFAWRAPKVGLGGKFALISRETFLLANNVLLLVATGAVLLGTLYPLFIDALDLGKISVGPPYFDAVFLPLMAPAIFLMGIGPFARWKEQSLPELAKRLKWAFGVALLSALLMPLTLGKWTPLISFGLLLAFWVIATGVYGVWSRLSQTPGTMMSRIAKQSPSWWGMQVAHLGIAIFIIGVTLVKGYETERDVRMALGSAVAVHPYSFTFRGAKPQAGPNYQAWVGTVEVFKNDKLVATLHPEKRNYFSTGMAMTEAAIDTGITRDLYVALGEPLENGAWSVRVYHKPFVDWIWGGCVLMALGGLLAISDRRYRLHQRSANASPTLTVESQA